MNWPVNCPHCGAEFDSHDSLSDSKAMLRFHIEKKHREEIDD